MAEQPGRVLFISPQPFFQWRGSPIRVGFNVQALAELGYEVDLLTLPIGEDRAVPGVRVHRVANWLGIRSVPIGPCLAKLWFDVFLLCKAIAMARKNRYIVIHAIEDAGIIGVLVARLCGTKAVFEKHSDPSSYRKGAVRNAVMAMYAGVERMAIRRAAAVIGTGAGLVAQARAVDPDKPAFHIFDIPSSLTEADPARAKELRGQFATTDDEVLALYVGSFAVYQGINLLFDAIPIVVRDSPRVRFVIIGGSDEEIAARRAELARQNVAEAVTFAGKVPPDELPSYLCAADILLSPRIAGTNTPLKLLDYLKAGRAILATDIEANRQILDDTTGVLTATDAPAFAAGAVRLAEDEARRRELGDRGRTLIDETYNYVEFKRRLQACYEAVGTTGTTT